MRLEYHFFKSIYYPKYQIIKLKKIMEDIYSNLVKETTKRECQNFILKFLKFKQQFNNIESDIKSKSQIPRNYIKQDNQPVQYFDYLFFNSDNSKGVLWMTKLLNQLDKSQCSLTSQKQFLAELIQVKGNNKQIKKDQNSLYRKCQGNIYFEFYQQIPQFNLLIVSIQKMGQQSMIMIIRNLDGQILSIIICKQDEQKCKLFELLLQKMKKQVFFVVFDDTNDEHEKIWEESGQLQELYRKYEFQMIYLKNSHETNNLNEGGIWSNQMREFSYKKKYISLAKYNNQNSQLLNHYQINLFTKLLLNYFSILLSQELPILLQNHSTEISLLKFALSINFYRSPSNLTRFYPNFQIFILCQIQSSQLILLQYSNQNSISSLVNSNLLQYSPSIPFQYYFMQNLTQYPFCEPPTYNNFNLNKNQFHHFQIQFYNPQNQKQNVKSQERFFNSLQQKLLQQRQFQNAFQNKKFISEVITAESQKKSVQLQDQQYPKKIRESILMSKGLSKERVKRIDLTSSQKQKLLELQESGRKIIEKLIKMRQLCDIQNIKQGQKMQQQNTQFRDNETNLKQILKFEIETFQQQIILVMKGDEMKIQQSQNGIQQSQNEIQQSQNIFQQSQKELSDKQKGNRYQETIKEKDRHFDIKNRPEKKMFFKQKNQLKSQNLVRDIKEQKQKNQRNQQKQTDKQINKIINLDNQIKNKIIKLNKQKNPTTKMDRTSVKTRKIKKQQKMILQRDNFKIKNYQINKERSKFHRKYVKISR